MVLLDRVVQRIFRASLLLRTVAGDVEHRLGTEAATEELAAALGDIQSTLLSWQTASQAMSTSDGDGSEG